MDMRRLICSFSSVCAALLVSSVVPAAADGFYRAPAASAPMYGHAGGWNGFYVGAALGYGFGSSDLTHSHQFGGAQIDQYSLDPDGVIGTGYLGFDRELSGPFVWGLFADYTFGDMGDRVTLATPGNANLRLEIERSWALGARVGVVHYDALWYLSAGYTGAEISLANLDDTRHGYFVGAGVERELIRNWRLKLDYRFSDYGDGTLFSGTTGCCVEELSADTSTHAIRLGLSYVLGRHEAPSYEPLK